MPLRAEDAAPTERDPAFPALSVLLDPESLAERISVLAPDLRGAEAVYLRYKPGTALFVGLVRDEPGSPRS
nr:hypothetical protein [Geodermatophilaceae bacterium]